MARDSWKNPASVIFKFPLCNGPLRILRVGIRGESAKVSASNFHLRTGIAILQHSPFVFLLGKRTRAGIIILTGQRATMLSCGETFRSCPVLD